MTGRSHQRRGKAVERETPAGPPEAVPYEALVGGIAEPLEEARRTSGRALDALMPAAYREIGRRILEDEQGGQARAAYGEALLEWLSANLTDRRDG